MVNGLIRTEEWADGFNLLRCTNPYFEAGYDPKTPYILVKVCWGTAYWPEVQSQYSFFVVKNAYQHYILVLMGLHTRTTSVWLVCCPKVLRIGCIWWCG